MHQPQYRRVTTGRYQLPWAYLHAVKDYADMAWHLEQTPGAKAVVNFTPVLLDQIDDYASQFETGTFRDDRLVALAQPESIPHDARPALIAELFRANVERMIRRFAPYAQLHELFEEARGSQSVDHLSDGFLADAAVWFHMAWLGETVRRTDPLAARLAEKARAFDAADRRALLALLGSTLRGIVPRYRALAQSGRIELSTSPYAHPIVPLLLDFSSARESMPDVQLPAAPEYPGGEVRAAAHVRTALESHRDRFGSSRVGCWPPEGGVSDAAVALFAEAGFAWTASCESVLLRTLALGNGAPAARTEYLYKPYLASVRGHSLPCFFRDVQLSDAIGFKYATWHADDAAANLVAGLSAIGEATREHDAPVVSIILDGENAWEHYPENAFYFLSALYRAIVAVPELRLTTFSEHLSRRRPSDSIGRLVAGSWVYGTFSTWIGDRDKNRAWDLLVRAKRDYDAAISSAALDATSRERAEAHLRSCEGSDWFWWFGDYNPADTVSDFDRLFRDHIRDLYAILRVSPPREVDEILGVGVGAPLYGGTMRQSLSPNG
jgi:alpha-amylase/alpha-mannosidase (GH57 family)